MSDGHLTVRALPDRPQALEFSVPLVRPTRIRLAWSPVPADEPRRATAWRLLRELLPSGVGLVNPCSRCGGPHGPVRATDASARLAVAYADGVAVVAVADAGHGGFAIDAEAEVGSARDAAGFDGVLGGRDDVRLRDWVRVEAALKADGRGLRIDPGAVAVTPVDAVEWHARVPGGAPVRGWDLANPAGLLISAGFSGAAGGAGVDRATRSGVRLPEDPPRGPRAPGSRRS